MDHGTGAVGAIGQTRRHRADSWRASCTRSTIRCRQWLRAPRVSRCGSRTCGRRASTIPENTEEYTEVIDQEVQRCKRIVDSLLTFSRPKTRRETRYRHQCRRGAVALPGEAPRPLQAAESPYDPRRQAGVGTGERRATHPGVDGAAHQRRRCDERQGHHHDPHTARDKRCRGRDRRGDRRWVGDSPERDRQDLRAVLHHEAGRARDRARPFGVLLDHRPARRTDRGRQRGGRRQHVPHRAA